MAPKQRVYKSTSIKYNKDANKLLIVESPSKCSKIEGFLGSEYACIASVGHLQTINSLKDIDTKNNYKPNFKVIEEKKGHISQMQKILNEFSRESIYIATDDDREGEAIAWHICILFGLDINNTKRIIFHEITKTAVINAVENPIIINMDLVSAQFSRQILDIMVGFKISPFLWKYLFNNKDNSLSAGRCQTPAVKLIYDNYKNNNDEINMSYKIVGCFTSQKISFNLNKNLNNYEEVKRFFKESIEWDYKLKIGDQKLSKISQPTPFNTSKLLQIAGNTLNLSPKHTMSICQKLYQAGYITYMRTESNKYAGAFIDSATKYIIAKYGDNYIGDKKKIENFDINNPHEAIRVTSLCNTIINDNKDPKTNSLYKLIYNNTIESCMKEYSANISVISITSPFKNMNYEYKNEIPIFLGWKIVKKADIDANKSAGELLYFKSILSNKIKYNKIKSNVSISINNSYYSEHSLINKLETLGIGRPSTFASIIDVIQTRNYVEKKNIEPKIKKIKEFILEDREIKEELIEKKYGEEKNKLIITNLGILTMDFLYNNFDSIFSYDYTKEMEKSLDEIATGKNKEWSSVCKLCDIDIKDKSKNIKNITKNAFKLDDKYDIVFEKYGPCLRYLDSDGEYKYNKIKNDIELDINKITSKCYKADELIEKEDDLFLGKYENNDVYKRLGKYGAYIEYNGNNKSIKIISKEFRDICLNDVIPIIKETNTNIFRVFTGSLSVRKGKYGAYAYYKKENMRKPEFYNIKKFKENFNECSVKTFIDWLCKNYDTKPEDFV